MRVTTTLTNTSSPISTAESPRRPKGALFRTIGRGTGKLTRTVLPQANAYATIRRRAAAAGIETSSATITSERRGSPPISRTAARLKM
jgi:hypothetical protein